MSKSEISRSVKKHGWHAILVSEANPPFAYTVGLVSSYQHPEVIVFGLEPQELYLVLRAFAEQVADGHSFREPGSRRPLLEGQPCAIKPVHPSHHSTYLEYAVQHSSATGTELEAIQCFWPDDEGRFPTDVRCDPHTCECQPRLDLDALPDFLGIRS